MSFKDEIHGWILKFDEQKKAEREFQTKAEILTKDFQAFLRRIGIPENFSIADVMKTSVERAND